MIDAHVHLWLKQDGKVNALTPPFPYGRHLVVRVAKLICEE